MKGKGRTHDSNIKVFALVVLFISLFKICSLPAQTGEVDHHKIYNDSLKIEREESRSIYLPNQKSVQNKHYKSSRGATKPLYLGYEVSFGVPYYKLKSDIPQLNNLGVSNFGGTAGTVFANPQYKLKANVGLYYSGDSVPYTFDLFTVNISSSIYLLRLQEINNHTIEPYITGGLSLQQIKFYGNYLYDTQQNFSVSEEQLLGKVISTQFIIGLGAEYQREINHVQFIHFFAEISFGLPLLLKSTSAAFDNTHPTYPLCISVGISFGEIKQIRL